MQCMVLHGDSNIGKTLIVSKLRREHPSIFDHFKGVECRQIIAMQMPATPDQHRFYTALRFELGAPHSTTASLSTLERLARDLHPRQRPRHRANLHDDFLYRWAAGCTTLGCMSMI